MAPTPTLRGPARLDAAAALARLVEGNQRYTAGQPLHPDQSIERLRSIGADQAPLAVVLTCADAQMPPELIFDQGLGDLFVARVAGNILSDVLLGSIEYAVQHFQIPLILVLGHQGCSALSAAVESVTKGREAAGHAASLVDALRPAVEAARQQPDDVLDKAVRANITLMLKQLRTESPLLEEKLGRDELKLAGGYHSLDTGGVEMVG